MDCDNGATLALSAETERAQVKTKRTDSRIATDLAILNRMRKKTTIDFVQWTDDAQSARAEVDGAKRSGHWATLHDVRPIILVSLPEEVLDRPVAALEFSIDFVAKRAATNRQQLDELIQVYDLLHRRLAPWRGYQVHPGMRRSAAKGTKDSISSGKPTFGTRADGTKWVKGAPARSLRVQPPLALGPELIMCHTVYFGHKVSPSWHNLEQDAPSMAQVKLYIKVTDNHQPIPRALWRTRMEVTLNAPPLGHVLGVRAMRDLLDADMRKLVKEYLQLYSPQPMRAGKAKFARSEPALAAFLTDRVNGISARDTSAAVADGNFTQLEDGSVEFSPATTLNRSIRSAAEEFQRSLGRAKATGKPMRE